MSVILYFLIGILSLILLLLFDYVKNIQFYKNGAKLPGPKAFPIVGNALTYIGMDSTAAHEKILEIAETFSSPFRGWLGNQLFVGIYEPEQIKTLLTSTKSMGKGSLYRHLRPWLGNSLLLAPVSIWRAHRKLIQPAFNPLNLRAFVHIFDKHSKSLVKKMEKELDGGEFEVRSYLVPFSFNAALEGSMDISETSDSNIQTYYAECVDRAFELAMKRAWRLWLHADIIFNLTKMSKDFYEKITWMQSTAHSIIARKKKELAKVDKAKKDEFPNQRKVFLDILLDLQDKQKFSEQEVCDEANLMIAAAYDTVSVALQYIMLILASYPDVQEKVYQELKHIYSKVVPENVSVTSEDLKQMKYLERVIHESMRLFPTVSFVTRKVDEDLEIGGYTLPKGCSVFCCIAKIHRDEKYWPNPLKFDPDRFLPEEVAKRHPYCYLPFSGGPRNCIGSLYAMMEMKTSVARILLKYVLNKKHIQPIIKIKQRPEIVSHPLEPITIEIVKRLPDI